jgi:ribonuclease-3
MASTWEQYVAETCGRVEKELLGGEPFKNREILIRSLTRSAVLNEAVEYEEMKAIGHQRALATLGDSILDYAIIEKFAKKHHGQPEEINALRERYGKNAAIHAFAKETIKLQDYLIWGPNEQATKRWEEERTDLLADCFEALVGAIYLDQGIKKVGTFLKEIHFFETIDGASKT